jgi:2-succinyl-6-hydroxy-2,4-cyclohexadiene-1-carboxylate synthase
VAHPAAHELVDESREQRVGPGRGITRRIPAVPALVLIHGFAGGAGSWEEVIGHLDRQRYRPLALELPGHGASAEITPVGYEQAASMALALDPGPLVLCGYSLGARVALGAALMEPRRVAGLMLVSGHAGIEDETRRRARERADAALAERIESLDAVQFAALWNDQEIFAGEAPEVHERARRELLNARPDRLGAVLRVLGAAAFDPAWSRLGEIGAPVKALAGAQDGRYPVHAERIAALTDGEAVILSGGHRQHLEHPAVLARELEALGAQAG